MSDFEGDGGGGAAAALLGGASFETPPAGAPQDERGGVPAQVVEGAPDPEWYSTLSAEAGEGAEASNRDWVKARGAKTLDEVVKGFRDTQRAFHDKGMVKIPGADAKPEEIAAFRTAIGVPDSVEGYVIERPVDEAGEPLKMAEGLISAATQAALEEGLPAGPFKNFMAKVIHADIADQNAALAKGQAEARAWLKEQGAAGAAKIAAIDTAARVIGLSKDEVIAARSMWGAQRSAEIFAKLGEGLSEDTFLSGAKPRFGVTGAEAKAQLTSRMGDKAWAGKAVVTGTPENAEYVRLRDASAAYDGAQAGEG